MTTHAVQRKKILERMYSLKTLYRLMVARGAGYGMEMNEAILIDCVSEYFKDLDRHKTRQNIPYADQHKRAAYTIKWLVKLRPIQLTETKNPVPFSAHIINELFALSAGLEHLNLPNQAVSFFTKSYTRNLLFNLRHHPVAAETLASEMYLLECAYNGTTP